MVEKITVPLENGLFIQDTDGNGLFQIHNGDQVFDKDGVALDVSQALALDSSLENEKAFLDADGNFVNPDMQSRAVMMGFVGDPAAFSRVLNPTAPTAPSSSASGMRGLKGVGILAGVAVAAGALWYFFGGSKDEMGPVAEGYSAVDTKSFFDPGTIPVEVPPLPWEVPVGPAAPKKPGVPGDPGADPEDPDVETAPEGDPDPFQPMPLPGVVPSDPGFTPWQPDTTPFAPGTGEGDFVIEARKTEKSPPVDEPAPEGDGQKAPDVELTSKARKATSKKSKLDGPVKDDAIDVIKDLTEGSPRGRLGRKIQGGGKHKGRHFVTLINGRWNLVYERQPGNKIKVIDIVHNDQLYR